MAGDAALNTLFEMPTFESPAPVWIRHAGSLGKLNTVHVHARTGLRIEHCGHPTANFPYVIYSRDGERTLAPNGRGFQRLELAKQFIEALPVVE